MNLAELNYLSYAFLELLIGTAFRSACFAALCVIALWLFRARKPAFTHFLWSAALYALLLLPLLQVVAAPIRRVAPLLPQPRISFLAPQSNGPLVRSLCLPPSPILPLPSAQIRRFHGCSSQLLRTSP